MYKYIDEKGEHLHTLDGKPLIGGSTVTKVISKNLTWWASGMAVGKMGWINPKPRVDGKYTTVPLEQRISHVDETLTYIKGLSAKEYLSLLDEAYKAHDELKKSAATKGTDRHSDLEDWVKECIKNGGRPLKNLHHTEQIKPFVDWAWKNVNKFLWSEMHCYSKELWTGGIADIGWEDMGGRVVAGDAKSSKEAYFDQFVQTAGYALMIEENGGYTKNGEVIMEPLKSDALCVIPFGQKVLEPTIIYDVESYKTAFKCALSLHKLQQQFNEIQ